MHGYLSETLLVSSSAAVGKASVAEKKLMASMAKMIMTVFMLMLMGYWLFGCILDYPLLSCIYIDKQVSGYQ